MSMVAPVAWRAKPEARKAITLATSSGSPAPFRPAGYPGPVTASAATANDVFLPLSADEAGRDDVGEDVFLTVPSGNTASQSD